jgi:predicted nucleic acid-binding protein
LILVDTSVWIASFRQADSYHSQMLDRCLAAREVLLGDLIAAEVLQGIKHKREERLIAEAFASLPQRELCGMTIAVKAAQNYRRLRAAGVTVRGTVDVIIATWCIENGVPLLHDDRDFLAMEKALGLQVWR